ncbi:hypothetical protein HKX48_009489 [Thoreauomyces humboldtii]|nr:hypothetical protein HKX48_009489 [Thoreauomyces humboldtii]
MRQNSRTIESRLGREDRYQAQLIELAPSTYISHDPAELDVSVYKESEQLLGMVDCHKPADDLRVLRALTQKDDKAAFIVQDVGEDDIVGEVIGEEDTNGPMIPARADSDLVQDVVQDQNAFVLWAHKHFTSIGSTWTRQL